MARDSTERPEAIEAGTALLAGTDGERIAQLPRRLLDDPAHYAAMANSVNPFGDGHAACRIVSLLRQHLARPMKLLYAMHVNWNWIRQRPHVLAEQLAQRHRVELLHFKMYRRSHRAAECPAAVSSA